MRTAPTSTAMTNVYVPARSKYYPSDHRLGRGFLPANTQVQRYVDQEFPPLRDQNGCSVYGVPRNPIARSELRASKAEEIVFERLRDLNVPGLWLVFFQGRSYGGRSRRSEHSGRLMMREHDYVVFASHQGLHKVVLVEVKSTSDSSTDGVKMSDAKMVKNSKRSAQHQLRDHIEMLCAEEDLGNDLSSELNSFIFWPFLSSTTKNPQGVSIRRWKEDKNLHTFAESFISQAEFTDWFQENVLRNGVTLEKGKWNTLLKRFIILSCGVFVDEIHEGMMALLSQEQLDVLHRQPDDQGTPLIIHGAAGTGKTLIAVKKLQQLRDEGRLDQHNRALFICYWPGISVEVHKKLVALGIEQFVDMKRYFITNDCFIKDIKAITKGYKHVIMDEAEAICLAFEEAIIKETFDQIFRLYKLGNTDIQKRQAGSLWFLVDANQALIFIPKYSPKILKTPDVVLTKVIRSTRTIYNMFNQFYEFPVLNVRSTMCRTISVGHDIDGPPIYWIDSNSSSSCLEVAVSVIIDLCSRKGIKPNDLCLFPFLACDKYSSSKINHEIEKHFVEKGFMPQALSNVEVFMEECRPNQFLAPWAIRVKGLEFKVVVIAIEDEDFDFTDPGDRRKIYIMASRCTCLLVLVSPKSVKGIVDPHGLMKDYSFSLALDSLRG